MAQNKKLSLTKQIAIGLGVLVLLYILAKKFLKKKVPGEFAIVSHPIEANHLGSSAGQLGSLASNLGNIFSTKPKKPVVKMVPKKVKPKTKSTSFASSIFSSMFKHK